MDLNVMTRRGRSTAQVLGTSGVSLNLPSDRSVILATLQCNVEVGFEKIILEPLDAVIVENQAGVLVTTKGPCFLIAFS